MIKNQKQLEITLNSIKGFKAKKDEITLLNNNSKIMKIELNALDSMIQDLEKQVQYYYKIINNEYLFDEIDSFEKLSKYIICKRIQLKLDEDFLAKKIGVDLHYYYWLEENDFYGIDEELLKKLLNILDIRIKADVFANENAYNFGKVLDNLKILGINEGFIRQALGITANEVFDIVKQKKSEAIYISSRFIYYFKKVFGINLLEDIKGINPLEKSLSVAFKKPVNVKAENLNITTGYAAYVASLVSKQIIGKSVLVKPDPILIRNAIIEEYGEVTFETCLEYVWKLKIPSMPIDIKSGFHGACFDFSGVRTIVLNQQQRLVSRWKFDLLHELYHALTMGDNFYLENTDREQQISKVEIRASKFANYIIFGSDAETFLKLAVDDTKGDIRALKTSLQVVADNYKLNIDDLSNYAAYRLIMQGINWWGTTKLLQKRTEDPYNILVEFVIKNIKVDNYSDFERNLIITSLNKGGN